MKHVLVNKQGMQHAVILECPFKYTLPKNMDSFHDINHDFSQPYNYTGKKPVDTFCHTQPKSQQDVNEHAIDFAVIVNGVVENVVVWGGAEWCPPMGCILTPLEKWIGRNDLHDATNNRFTIHKDRLGKSDKDKSAKELEEDFKNSQINE